MARAVLEDYDVSSLLDVDQCRTLYEALEKRLNGLHQQWAECVQDITGVVGTALEQCSDLGTRCRRVIDQVHADGVQFDEVRDEAQRRFDQLNALECAVQYKRLLYTLQQTNDTLEREYRRNDEQSVTLYANLCEVHSQIGQLQAVHLKRYLRDLIVHWHGRLRARLAPQLADALKSIGWPFLLEDHHGSGGGVGVISTERAAMTRFRRLCEFLLDIELPEDVPEPTKATYGSPERICLLIELLAEPLRKRFLYHFTGNKQTNRPEKPEWYFTQVLSWIRDHEEFVELHVQPIADALSSRPIDACHEFHTCLVRLAVDKLDRDMSHLQFDDTLFAHCVDEALRFQRDLVEMYDFGRQDGGVFSVLTQPPLFIKWLKTERKFATDKIDRMLHQMDGKAFQHSPIDDEADDGGNFLLSEPTKAIDTSKVPYCADAFIILLDTITDRYARLPQPGHRMQFFELQLDLLEEFRMRLLQLAQTQELCANPLDSLLPALANASHYIEHTLTDWSTSLHFITLHFYRQQQHQRDPDDNSVLVDDGDGDSDENAFGDMPQLYNRLSEEIVNKLTLWIIDEIRSQSRVYRSAESWSTMVRDKDSRTLSLTPSAIAFLDTLSRSLHLLDKQLNRTLFENVWRSTAQKIDRYLFEHVVLDNRFGVGGAIQFKFDVERNLIPVFMHHLQQVTDGLFMRLMDSCTLLNLAKGSALLLKATLVAFQGATGIEDARPRTLKDLGVRLLDPQSSLNVLNRRLDVCGLDNMVD